MQRSERMMPARAAAPCPARNRAFTSVSGSICILPNEARLVVVAHRSSKRSCLGSLARAVDRLWSMPQRRPGYASKRMQTSWYRSATLQTAQLMAQRLGGACTAGIGLCLASTMSCRDRQSWTHACNCAFCCPAGRLALRGLNRENICCPSEVPACVPLPHMHQART